MSLLIVGSVALDSVKTPFGDHKNIVGGSATHASVSASFHTDAKIVGVVGSDFPQEHIDFLHSRNIDTEGVEIVEGGKTFKWEGYYEGDMNQAITVDTQLNVFADFDPKVPDSYKNSEFLFLGNIHPVLQLKVLDSINQPKMIGLDSMNLWIDIEKDALTEVLKRVDLVFINDAEIRQYTGEINLIKAAKKLLDLGVKYVLLKKGEHGAMLIGKDVFFAAPAYPVESVFDPTGAGDSFAGGFMGYLSKTNDLSVENLKKALITGTVMSSYNVEEFSLNRFRTLSDEEIVKRFKEMRIFTSF